MLWDQANRELRKGLFLLSLEKQKDPVGSFCLSLSQSQAHLCEVQSS